MNVKGIWQSCTTVLHPDISNSTQHSILSYLMFLLSLLFLFCILFHLFSNFLSPFFISLSLIPNILTFSCPPSHHVFIYHPAIYIVPFLLKAALHLRNIFYATLISKCYPHSSFSSLSSISCSAPSKKPHLYARPSLGPAYCPAPWLVALF